MNRKPRSYRGAGITVSYDSQRCIHAAECVRGLPEVFDPRRRPWIAPDAAHPQRVAEVVRACPTGALRYEPAPAVDAEAVPAHNTVQVSADGPLYLRGDLRLADAEGEEQREVRVALCRCGASSDKPFCDNSHLQAGFEDSGAVGDGSLPPLTGGVRSGELRIAGAVNGPLLVEGPLELLDAGGETVATGSKAALCRCGASRRKPFCDGSHVAIGFESNG